VTFADLQIAVLVVGTLGLLIGWPLVKARLTRYDARDHDRAQLRHYRRNPR
jgi:hypothetical protein